MIADQILGRTQSGSRGEMSTLTGGLAGSGRVEESEPAAALALGLLLLQLIHLLAQLLSLLLGLLLQPLLCILQALMCNSYSSCLHSSGGALLLLCWQGTGSISCTGVTSLSGIPSASTALQASGGQLGDDCSAHLKLFQQCCEGGVALGALGALGRRCRWAGGGCLCGWRRH